MNYNLITSLVKNAISGCQELNNARIVNAYPPQRADSPVKRTICSVGVLSAQNKNTASGGSEATVYVDIYTPSASGGDFSASCALSLCNMPIESSGKYSISSAFKGTSFFNNCCAYVSRVEISFCDVKENISEDKPENSFNIFIDNSAYICRKISIKNQNTLSAVECYGENHPADFIQNSRLVTVTVNRCPADDGKSLCHLSYPFKMDFSADYCPALNDCAVTKYEIDESLNREIVTIVGRSGR